MDDADRAPDPERDHHDFAESDALIDEALATGESDEVAETRPVDKFRRTAAGSMVAAGLFGLRDALEGRPEKEEPAIVVDAPTPKSRGPVEVTLDFEHPERSKVVIRRPPEPEAADVPDDAPE